MRVAFIIPNYPDETRVAILPDDLEYMVSRGLKVIIESGFGATLDISDDEYLDAGAIIEDRQGCYAESVIFNLKLTQPEDYRYLRSDHIIVGWTHPFGSGESFYRNVSAKRGITLVDIDSVNPMILRGSAPPESISVFPEHMFWKNSYNAGIASVDLAMQNLSFPDTDAAKVCVLGSGSVAQGAFYRLSRLGYMPRIFYRKTMPIFYDEISTYDVVVSGIEVDTPGLHIIDRANLEKMKLDVILVDAAADAGNAIQGTEYMSVGAPVGKVGGRRYVLINNAPTIMPAVASRDISYVVSNHILPKIAENSSWFGVR